MSRVTVTAVVVGGTVVANVAGEIDMANAASVVGEVASAGEDAAGLVVDIAAVTYLDSSGVNELFTLVTRRTADRRRTALVVPDGSPLHRLFKITKFEEAAPVCASPEAAMAAVTGDGTGCG